MSSKTRLSLFISAFFILMIAAPSPGRAQGGNLIDISGRVVDDARNPLGGVSVSIKNTISGTVTNDSGYFSLRTRFKFPLTLVFSSVGFQTQEFEVKSIESKLYIALLTQTSLGKEVVVTASRVSESRLKSPVAIEKLDIRAIRESAAPSFYDALENVKGVQMTTSSLTFKVPNTRGFNIPNNFRFMQLVDGVDMQAATLGVPLGNAIGPTELDIASVEITPGAASALYGLSAINGLANLQTKDPFTYQGLSVYQKTGVNHVDGIDDAPSLLTETAIRYAKAFNNRVAFKVNVGYMQGIDWRSNTRLDQNPNNLKSANPGFPALNGDANVAFDGWNKYGDDALAGSNLVSLSGLTIDGKPNQTLRVARTGYWETDLVSPKVSNFKVDASLLYRLNEKLEISYGYRAGVMSGVFQRGNKVRLNNVLVQNHHLQLKGNHFLINGYVLLENTGDSYNVKPLADNMDLYSGGATDTKTATSWGTKFKNALNEFSSENGGALTSANLAAATQYARLQADASRVKPGTPEFDQLKNTIININNWDIKSSSIPDAPVTGGAALVQRSHTYHLEGQWDLSDKVKIFDLLIGGDGRIYEVVPDGNNFVDFSRPIDERNKPEPGGGYGKDVYYKKFGAFTQVTKTFFEERLKLFGSIRWDYNPEFKPVYTPRLAAVYTFKENHNFRFTFQEGYRFPALFEALSYVNNGRVKRVGSLPYINQGLGYLENSYTQQSVINFNAAVSAQGNTDAAALANRDLLVVANLPDAGPERIISYEAGYKSVLLDNRLVIDIDAYANQYNGFLGQVQVYVPKGETVGSDAAVLAMLDRNRDATAATATTAASQGQDRYRVYTNAKNTYHNFGSSLAITYNIYKKYTVAGNINYNEMKANSSDDIFVTGFNTPRWSTNLSFGNRQIAKNVGFNVTWRWQDAFYWESPLVNGTVSAYSTIDAQITFHLPELKSYIKVGGSDIFNHRYIQYAGGPTIGALYYVAVTVDGLLK
ncbi:MAG TPA: TonB-dependent receptor [Puia sp.]|nr:TonB-dependent receptor [Puia sp.]